MWIRLPIEFKGIWISHKHGGFTVSLQDRLSPSYPKDTLFEYYQQDPYLSSFKASRKPHQHADPVWISKGVLEEMYGEIELVLVDDEEWKDAYRALDTPDEKSLLIFTKEHVITLGECDGAEFFIALPRSPEIILKYKLKHSK